MESNTTGSQNAAFGQASLNYNTVGGNNTALGNASLFYNTSGSTNVGVGTQSLFRNDGSSNSAVGNQSLFNNSTGNENSSLGSSSGATNTTGNYNTYLGSNADATVNSFSKAVAIGYNAKVGASNAMVLGGTGIDAVNVGINTTTPATSARLDLVSTSSGFAMPRMTSIQRKAIASPIDGLQVIDTDLKGIYIYFGGKWDCVSVPAGSTGYFANTIAPNGYLECNGQAVNRTTYAELFAAIGTVYGVGDGSTTFNVPDLRGEFVRGVDNARGVDAGRAIGTAQTDDFKSHNHQLSSKIIVEGNVGISDVGGGNPAGGWGFTSLTGGSETRPRNVAMLPCIKF
ncbi:MAG: tail fiber protein [Bacteroidia bacterium]|nr:tail fiber protein [Bacteroidia bacterium]